MIIIDTVLIWALRIIMAGAFAGAGCMVALVLIHDKRIKEAKETIRRYNEELKEVPDSEWEVIE